MNRKEREAICQPLSSCYDQVSTQTKENSLEKKEYTHECSTHREREREREREDTGSNVEQENVLIQQKILSLSEKVTYSTIAVNTKTRKSWRSTCTLQSPNQNPPIPYDDPLLNHQIKICQYFYNGNFGPNRKI